jgi:hypothetical protein
MLVACRLAGLSALGAHYAGVKWRAMWGFHNMPLRPLPRHAPENALLRVTAGRVPPTVPSGCAALFFALVSEATRCVPAGPEPAWSSRSGGSGNQKIGAQ